MKKEPPNHEWIDDFRKLHSKDALKFAICLLERFDIRQMEFEDILKYATTEDKESGATEFAKKILLTYFPLRLDYESLTVFFRKEGAYDLFCRGTRNTVAKLLLTRFSEKLGYKELINMQNSDSAEIRNLAAELARKIPVEQLDCKTLINFQNSKYSYFRDSNHFDKVRYLAFELAMKIPANQLNYKELISLYSANNAYMQHLITELGRKIPRSKLDFEFLTEFLKSNNAFQCKVFVAKLLLIHFSDKLDYEELIKMQEVYEYEVTGPFTEVVRTPAAELARKIPANKLDYKILIDVLRNSTCFEPVKLAAELLFTHFSNHQNFKKLASNFSDLNGNEARANVLAGKIILRKDKAIMRALLKC